MSGGGVHLAWSTCTFFLLVSHCAAGVSQASKHEGEPGMKEATLTGFFLAHAHAHISRSRHSPNHSIYLFIYSK